MDSPKHKMDWISKRSSEIYAADIKISAYLAQVVAKEEYRQWECCCASCNHAPIRHLPEGKCLFGPGVWKSR
jgi:hypothetical protein